MRLAEVEFDSRILVFLQLELLYISPLPAHVGDIICA